MTLLIVSAALSGVPSGKNIELHMLPSAVATASALNLFQNPLL